MENVKVVNARQARKIQEQKRKSLKNKRGHLV
jgi:hypothetical protein